MDYLKHYNKLIEKRRSELPLGYSERHHIIPRCMGGTDERENLIRLSPEEHYVAHLLLCKIYPGVRGLAIAVMFLTADNGKRNNKKHGWVRRKISEQMKGDDHLFKINDAAREANQRYMRSDKNPQVLNPRAGKRHHFYGKKNPVEWSEESRKKISEGKMGIKNPFFGKRGWEHPTCTTESKIAWARADEVFDTMKANPKWGYSKISKALAFDTPHRSIGITNRIKEGWNPKQDTKWKEWKNTYDKK